MAIEFSFYSHSQNIAEIKLVLHVVPILVFFTTYPCHVCYLVFFTWFAYLGSDCHIGNHFEARIASKCTRSAVLECVEKKDTETKLKGLIYILFKLI